MLSASKGEVHYLHNLPSWGRYMYPSLVHTPLQLAVFAFTDTTFGWNISKASGNCAGTWTLPTSKLLRIVDLSSKHIHKEAAETCLKHRGTCLGKHSGVTA